MTCFWTGVVSALLPEDFERLGLTTTPTLPTFIQKLKEIAAAADTFELKWQGTYLTASEIQEQKEAIRDYNIDGIGNGHWTSSCDPFLCLLTHVLEIQIDFRYMNNLIVFESTKPIRKRLQFAASESHFVRMCS